MALHAIKGILLVTQMLVALHSFEPVVSWSPNVVDYIKAMTANPDGLEVAYYPGGSMHLGANLNIRYHIPEIRQALDNYVGHDVVEIRLSILADKEIYEAEFIHRGVLKFSGQRNTLMATKTQTEGLVIVRYPVSPVTDFWMMDALQRVRMDPSF